MSDTPHGLYDGPFYTIARGLPRPDRLDNRASEAPFSGPQLERLVTFSRPTAPTGPPVHARALRDMEKSVHEGITRVLGGEFGLAGRVCRAIQRRICLAQELSEGLVLPTQAEQDFTARHHSGGFDATAEAA